MSSAASAASGTGSPALARPDAAESSLPPVTRSLSWVPGIGIGSSILIMIVASAARHSPADVAIVLAFLALAILLLWRLPDAVPSLPAALAFGLAGLFLWHCQLPWYDTMIIGLLALYPAARLDYVVIWLLTAGTFALLPGGSSLRPPEGLLMVLNHDAKHLITPLMLIAAVVALVLLCITGDWNIRADRLDYAGPGGGSGVGVR